MNEVQLDLFPVELDPLNIELKPIEPVSLQTFFDGALDRFLNEVCLS